MKIFIRAELNCCRAMAARVSKSVVDLASLATKIPAEQKGAYNALVGKVQKHLANVNALPAAKPAIDFAAYSKVRSGDDKIFLIPGQNIFPR